MAEEKAPWFITERSVAIAGLLLTSRNDVTVRFKQEHDGGIDLLVELDTEGDHAMRMMAVQVKGTTSSEPSDWKELVKGFFRSGPNRILMPTSGFVVNVRDNMAVYAWVAEPIIVKREANNRRRSASLGVF